MKRVNAISGLAFCGASLGVGWQALALPLGSFRAPGPGLYPLGLAVLLGACSLALVLLRAPAAAAAGLDAAGEEPAAPSPSLWKVYATIAVLLAYAALLPAVGILVTTVLFLGALFAIGGMRGAGRLVGLALILTVSLHLLMGTLLGVPMPAGALWSWLFPRWFGG